MDDMMNFDSRDDLLAALCREDATRDSDIMFRRNGRRLNWLDAAPATQLEKVTEKVLLSCVQRMAIRSSGYLEAAFAIKGYNGKDFALRDSHPRAAKAFFDQNAIFYQRLKRRLADIRHIEIMSGQVKDYSFENREDDDRVPSLYLAYERYRWSTIESGQKLFVPTLSWCDVFFWPVSKDILDESTDAIILAAASRMAIRSSLRLEVMWKDAFCRYGASTDNSVPLLGEYVEERDGAVQSYLDIREEQAKAAYSQSLIDKQGRAGPVADESPDSALDA